MSATKEYSCVKKTKREFERSLVALSKEKALSKITVKEICERAQLSRNAFYFHYADIDDLILDIRKNMIAEIETLFNKYKEVGFPENIYTVISSLTDLFVEHEDTTIMLIDCSKRFIDELNKLHSDFFFEYFKAYHHTDSRELYDMFYSYLSSGFNGMYRYWRGHRDTVSKSLFIHLAYVFGKRLVALEDPVIEPIVIDLSTEKSVEK